MHRLQLRAFGGRGAPQVRSRVFSDDRAEAGQFKSIVEMVVCRRKSIYLFHNKATLKHPHARIFASATVAELQ